MTSAEPAFPGPLLLAVLDAATPFHYRGEVRRLLGAVGDALPVAPDEADALAIEEIVEADPSGGWSVPDDAAGLADGAPTPPPVPPSRPAPSPEPPPAILSTPSPALSEADLSVPSSALRPATVDLAREDESHGSRPKGVTVVETVVPDASHRVHDWGSARQPATGEPPSRMTVVHEVEVAPLGAGSIRATVDSTARHDPAPVSRPPVVPSPPPSHREAPTPPAPPSTSPAAAPSAPAPTAPSLPIPTASSVRTSVAPNLPTPTAPSVRTPAAPRGSAVSQVHNPQDGPRRTVPSPAARTTADLRPGSDVDQVPRTAPGAPATPGTHGALRALETKVEQAIAALHAEPRVVFLPAQTPVRAPEPHPPGPPAPAAFWARRYLRAHAALRMPR